MLARLADSHLVVLYVNDPLLATAAATRHGGRALLASADADLQQFVRAALRRATPPVATTLLTIAGKPPRGNRGSGGAARLRSDRDGLPRCRPRLAVPVRIDDGRRRENDDGARRRDPAGAAKRPATQGGSDQPETGVVGGVAMPGASAPPRADAARPRLGEAQGWSRVER